ncbi:MAG: hypothetical protein D3924_20110, partial [Candidatus Electrothrix sp. AR4]|nr:hypothetical protein [Candidatus Electrothrix sp. AR4]
FLPSKLRQKNIARLREKAAPLDIVMGFGPLSFFDLPAVYDGIALAKAQGLAMIEHTMENPEEARRYQERVEHYLERYGEKLAPQDQKVLNAVMNIPPLSAIDGMVKLRRFAGQLLGRDGVGRALSPEDKALLAPLRRKLPSVVPLLDHLDVLPGFVSVHSVWLNPADIKAYADKGAVISHNPESNMYLSSGVAPLVEYQEAGVPVTLATDGAASNDRIDFFTAMRSMTNLQKAYNMNAELSSEIEPWDILEAATIAGAKALALEKRTGSIAPGKEADLVLLNRDVIGMAPYVGQKKVDNRAAIIVNSASARDVNTVISDGNIVVAEGQLQGHDEADLARRLDEIADKVVRRVRDGKLWDQVYPLSGLQQYASVRKADRL